MAEQNNYHWIVYHLEAMNYAHTKLEKKTAELPGGHSLAKLDSGQLRKVIGDLKAIMNWYEEQIKYHQEKAYSHVPENEKTKNAKQRREMENKSYENCFITADQILPDKAQNEDFKTMKTDDAGDKT